MATPTQADQDQAEELLGNEDGYEPTKWAIAQALADARERGAIHAAQEYARGVETGIQNTLENYGRRDA